MVKDKMAASLNTIIKAIAQLNNKYRDSNSTTKQKLEALWEIGDCLLSMGVDKPHSMGWSIQRETKGLIKRPTIFRGCKIRQIWKSKDQMLGEIGSLAQMSNFIEMLPLVDPKQDVRAKLSKEELGEIYKRASSKDVKGFKKFLSEIKKKYSHGRLGKPLDKSKHLSKLENITENLKKLQLNLLKSFQDSNVNAREEFIRQIPPEEFRAFSNMCLSLTTKDNFKLYKKLGAEESKATIETFKTLYDFFKEILSRNDDIERARLRRLISAEALAQLSDMISSIQSEESIKDFKARQKFSIGM